MKIRKIDISGVYGNQDILHYSISKTTPALISMSLIFIGQNKTYFRKAARNWNISAALLSDRVS